MILNHFRKDSVCVWIKNCYKWACMNCQLNHHVIRYGTSVSFIKKGGGGAAEKSTRIDKQQKIMLNNREIGTMSSKIAYIFSAKCYSFNILCYYSVNMTTDSCVDIVSGITLESKIIIMALCPTTGPLNGSWLSTQGIITESKIQV